MIRCYKSSTIALTLVSTGWPCVPCLDNLGQHVRVPAGVPLARTLFSFLKLPIALFNRRSQEERFERPLRYGFLRVEPTP